MDKAWIFFGHSASYKCIIGGFQILASPMLFFRRTTLIGLLLLLTIGTNIVYLNFAFDIPVKFDSCFYVVINLYLFFFYLPQAKTFIVENPEPQFISRLGLQKANALLGIAIVGIVVIAFTLQLRNKLKDTWKTPLYGIYDVSDVLEYGHPDSTRNFKTFCFDIGTLLNIRHDDNKIEWADYKITEGDFLYFEAGKIFKGTYRFEHGTNLILKGMIGKDSISVNLYKRKEKKK